MQWSDEGLILSVRPHGETAAVVDVLTARHGRHAGLVYGGRSRRSRPVLQIGNHVDIVWRARVSDQLGAMSLELRHGYAAEAMSDAAALSCLTSIAVMARLLPERDPHPGLYEVTMFVLSFLDDRSVWPALYARWEIALLDEMGFGLDLEECASTGTRDNLIYVSPRSGRAVSEAAGEPYKSKLLPLPAFLRPGNRGAEVTSLDIANALVLTRHFIEARLLQPAGQPMPDVRTRLAEILARP